MICIYDKAATKTQVLNTYGLAVLDNICTKAEITETLNGDYTLSAIFKIDTNSTKHDYIVQEAIIKLPDVYGNEVFRINDIVKRSNGKEIEVHARHITYDVANLFIESVNVTDGNGVAYLTAFFGATTATHEFTFSSDYTGYVAPGTTYYKLLTLHDALFNNDCSFMKIFGGEVLRRQYNITINTQVGADNGVRLQSRKNLQGFEAHTNLDNIVTRIYPFGANDLTIPEKYVDSTNISNYAFIRSKKIEFDDIRVDSNKSIDTTTAQQMLRDAANAKFTDEKIDIFNAEYTIDFIDLKNTEEYKYFEVMETVNLGDVILVKEKNFNINIAVRATQRVYNALTKVTGSITLSNISQKTLSNMRKITNAILDLQKTKRPKLYVGTEMPTEETGQYGDIYIQFT